MSEQLDQIRAKQPDEWTAADVLWLIEQAEELVLTRTALADLADLAGTVAISAAATAELAQMLRTNQPHPVLR